MDIESMKSPSDEDVKDILRAYSRVYMLAWEIAGEEKELWQTLESLGHKIPFVHREWIAKRLSEQFLWFAMK